MSSTKESSAGSFLKQGSILAAASILVRIIGLIYRVPMANVIGDEGNGIYAAAFEIYNILLIISSYGMPMAVSKMVSAKCVQKKYKSAYKIFKHSMVISVCTGGSMALFVLICAEWIEKNFYSKFEGIAIPLRVLAPTIFIVAVMGVFRGLFQGRGTMLPTAVSQIFEQIINAIVSVAAAYFFMRAHSASDKLAAWGAAGGTLGTCLGAVTALFILVAIFMLYLPVFRKQTRRDKSSGVISTKETYKIIFATVIPIILSQTVYQLSGIVDVTVFNNMMDAKGISAKEVSTLQGIYSTNYKLLVSVPIAISTAIASSMIPSLVRSYAGADYEGVKEKAAMAVKFNMIIAFPSAMGLAILGQPIIRIIYPSSDYATGGMMLLTGSTCIIFYALSTVTNGVLQSVDKMSNPVKNSFISLVIHVILLYAFLKWTSLGAFALVIGNVTYPLVVCMLNARDMVKYLKYNQEITKTFCIPFLSCVIMGILTYIVYQGVFFVTHKIYIAIIPAILIAVISYFALVLKLQGLSREELYEFPMGRKMSVIADKFHLLKK